MTATTCHLCYNNIHRGLMQQGLNTSTGITRQVFWPKSCPRCLRGDVALQEDVYGTYKGCLQCGWHMDVKIHNFGKADKTRRRRDPGPLLTTPK